MRYNPIPSNSSTSRIKKRKEDINNCTGGLKGESYVKLFHIAECTNNAGILGIGISEGLYYVFLIAKSMFKTIVMNELDILDHQIIVFF